MDRPTEQHLRQTVPYAPCRPGIGRRAQRVVIGVAMLVAVSIAGVAGGPTLLVLWTDYRNSRAVAAINGAREATRRALLPNQSACMDYLAPPGTLVYAEDPAGVAALSNGRTPRRIVGVSSHMPSAVPVPVAADDPPCLAALPPEVMAAHYADFPVDLTHPTGQSVIYLHQCQAASGPRLVIVYISGRLTSLESVPSRDDKCSNFDVIVQRFLVASVLYPATSQSDLTPAGEMDGDLRSDRFLITETAETATGLRMDQTPPLRLYAGYPDPADPTQFIIPYRYGSDDGTITGRLEPKNGHGFIISGPLARSDVNDLNYTTPSPDVRRATGKPR